MSSKTKRPCEEVFTNCKTLLFDVEGTTTSISFVKNKLFPYVRSNLETYVKKQWSSEEFKTDLTLLREQAVKDVADKVEGCVAIPDEGSDVDLQAAVIANVLWQMDGDRKTKALKQLQGHLMREGYEQGELKGHLYSDVAPAMRAWVENGLKLYIYSSGSVEAQKLLFGHSEEGNLLKMFQGHFDTEIGPKQDVASYASISKQVSCSPSEVIFFTDIPAEAMAAEGAGMTAVLVVREENAPLSEDDQALYQVIDSFDGFLCGSPLKRRKVSVDSEVPITDVEMTDVSEASTPVTPNAPNKPVEKEATNNVETDIEKKIEGNTDISMTDDKAECKPPTIDKPQTLSEEKEFPKKDIEESKCIKTQNSKPKEDEEDKNKEVIEAEHASKDKMEKDNIKLDCKENCDLIKLSTSTFEAPTEIKSKEIETAAENNSEEEPQILLSKGDKLEAPLKEKATPEKTVIDEDKVTEIVKDAVSVQLETSQAKDTAEVKKCDADEEKVVLTQAKEVVEEKEASSPLDKTEEEVEKIEKDVPQPMDAVVSKDTERIDEGSTVEVPKELEPKSSTGDGGSIDKNNVVGKVGTLEKIDISDTKIESEKCLEKNDIAEINVVSSVSEKINGKMECEALEKVDTISTNVEEVTKKVDTVSTIVEVVAKKVDTFSTNVEKVAEKVDIISTNVEKVAEEVDTTNVEKVAEEVDTTNVGKVAEEVDTTNVEKIAEKVDTVSTNGEKVDTISSSVEKVAEEVDTVSTNVEKVSEKVDTVDKTVSVKEVQSMETDVSEKSVLSDTMTGNDQETDKLNGGGVEMGQGDAGTLVELSKNVENGKDSIQVEEIKVKKVLADNASDDTENAVPVTMET